MHGGISYGGIKKGDHLVELGVCGQISMKIKLWAIGLHIVVWVDWTEGGEKGGGVGVMNTVTKFLVV